MRAVVFCVLSIQSGVENHIREVFVMPADGMSIHHISSPCASCNAELSKKICYALANKARVFDIDENRYHIMEHKVFDWDYIAQYRESPIVDFVSDIDQIVTIHVYEWKTACSLKKHKTIDKRAIVLNIKDSQPVIINVFYCPICDKYWLHKSALLDYQKHGIYPSARFHYYDPCGTNDYGMQRESTLKQYGYNVQSGGMPEGERHRLLRALVEYNLLTRREIVDHIDFCIRIPGARRGMECSVEKWDYDMRFVQDLPVKGNRAVLGYLSQP